VRLIDTDKLSNAISVDKKLLPVAFGYGLECDHTLESNPSVLWYLHTFTQPTMAARNRDAHEDLSLKSWPSPSNDRITQPPCDRHQVKGGARPDHGDARNGHGVKRG
jgi:hypothetical protein